MFALGGAQLNGIDISNYQYDNIVQAGRTIPDQTARWTDIGVEYVMLGTWYPEKTTPFIDAWRGTKTRILAAYAFLCFGFVDKTDALLAQAIDAAHRAGAEWVSLDVEAEPPYEAQGTIPTTRINDVERCVNAVIAAGLKPVIYSNKNYWEGHMASTTRFASLPIHIASYFYDLRILDTVDFGGFTDVWAHQVSATGNLMYMDAAGTLGPVPALDNIPVDYDQFFASAIQAPPAPIPPVEDEMTEDEIRAIVRDERAKAWAAGAPAELRHYIGIAINPVPGGFTDANGNLLPAVADAALTARVEALEAASGAGGAGAVLPDHTHVSGGVVR